MAILAADGFAQGEIDFEPSVWDLELGLHARELPDEQFVDYACGTNGGPPSGVIAGWTDYARCNAEAATGWHEVYFQYDDLFELVARARGDQVRAALFANTTVYSRPVIASALFDDDGFMRGLRLVTDPRNETRRELAYTLSGYLQARYDGDWQCENLPRLEGEAAVQNIYIKKLCTLENAATGIMRSIETHFYRRPGQSILDANNLPTEGYFESLTRFEEFLVGEIENRDERLAEIAALPPVEEDPLVVRARDCPGCDLSGASLRRADLRGANLAGANLEGASLHAADLTGANLAGANLGNANLNRAILTRANLSGAVLSGAMAYQARFDGADLSDVMGVLFLAARSRMLSATLNGAAFFDANLESVIMSNVEAVGATIQSSRLWNAQMTRSDFTGASLAGSDLLNATLTLATLAGANFRNTNLSEVDFRDSDLTNANLSGSLMTNALLGRANVEGAIFDGARLPAGFTPP
ncbi:MAG: pentapeptide repeat-containing protein [Bauldia sp.]|nr:pentapeptide repeat-containing protein [Bauldia sp.]